MLMLDGYINLQGGWATASIKKKKKTNNEVVFIRDWYIMNGLKVGEQETPCVRALVWSGLFPNFKSKRNKNEGKKISQKELRL